MYIGRPKHRVKFVQMFSFEAIGQCRVSKFAGNTPPVQRLLPPTGLFSLLISESTGQPNPERVVAISV